MRDLMFSQRYGWGCGCVSLVWWFPAFQTNHVPSKRREPPTRRYKVAAQKTWSLVLAGFHCQTFTTMATNLASEWCVLCAYRLCVYTHTCFYSQNKSGVVSELSVFEFSEWTIICLPQILIYVSPHRAQCTEHLYMCGFTMCIVHEINCRQLYRDDITLSALCPLMS
jgi:hypothetical protein